MEDWNKKINQLQKTQEFDKILFLYKNEIQDVIDGKSQLYQSTLRVDRAKLLVSLGLIEDAYLDSKWICNHDPNDINYMFHTKLLLRLKDPARLSEFKLEIEKLEKSSDVIIKMIDKALSDLALNPLARIDDDLNCPLCLKVLYYPVTTSCGHTFCRECLCRAMDFRPQCPLCREDLYVRPEKMSVTVLIHDLVQKYKPFEYEDRCKEGKEDGKLNCTKIPLFVLPITLFPSLSLQLHVFEPRYRLMIRRCLEGGDKSFGIAGVGSDGTLKRGTIARIVEKDDISDGRMLISLVGGDRFTVLDTWEVDGYTCAKVETFTDQKVDINEESFKKMETALLETYDTLNWRMQSALTEQFGPRPSDPVNLTWWIIAAICLTEKVEKTEELFDLSDPNERISKVIEILAEKKNPSFFSCELQ